MYNDIYVRHECIETVYYVNVQNSPIRENLPYAAKNKRIFLEKNKIEHKDD